MNRLVAIRVVHRAFDGTFVERQGVFTLYDDSLPQVCGTKAGSYVRLIDFGITQLKAQ